MDDKWLAKEVAAGIQKLMTLSLEGQPASELLRGTVLAWCEALETGRTLDRDIDTPRIRAAFSALVRDSRRWPAPRHFLDALPARPSLPALPRMLSDAEREAGMRRLEAIIATLDLKAKGD